MLLSSESLSIIFSMVLIFVQAGVGTYNPPGLITPISKWLGQTLDKGVAWFIYQHVMDGYRFLMQNYNAGDKICLFGGFGFLEM